MKDDSFDCTLIAHLRIFLLFYRLLYCLILPENRLFFGIWKVVEIERDKVLALDSGANDYVTKPFGAAELLARIRSALRNCSHSADSGKLPGGRFSVQDLEILYDARQVFIKGREIKLTQTEYNIVALLSEHCGKMMTYSAIIKGVWGYPDEGSVKKLQVNMANIRKKFGVKPGEATYITNELGVGYRMNSD